MTLHTLAPIIALHGHAQSGKDTIAGILSKYGYERVAFADALREALYRLNPVIGINLDIDGRPIPARLAPFVDEYGWEAAKNTGQETRRLLQVLGTEVGRELISNTVWIDIVRQKMADPNKRYVITDLRFPNEYDEMAKYGPDIVFAKVRRPGVGPVNGHVSDAGLPEYLFDVIIDNDGTIEDLADMVPYCLGLS